MQGLRKERIRFSIYILGSIMLIIIGILISIHTGYLDIPISRMIATFLGKGTSADTLTIFEFRLPRIVIALLVGMGIAISGTILQSISKNPLADPGVLGINAGAGFAIVTYTFFIQGLIFAGSPLSVFVMPLIALLGALFAAGIIYLPAWRKGSLSPTRMLLVGIGVNAAFGAAITVIQLKMEPTDFMKTVVWLSGSIWSSSWTMIFALLPWLLLFIPLAFYKSRVLDILSLNEITAIGVGISLNKERRNLLLIAVLLAGACVAVGGGITFLGLVAPHIAHRLVGSWHQRILPLSACIGALLVLFADILGRIVMSPAELPVGIILSMIGAPYFIYLLLKTK